MFTSSHVNNIGKFIMLQEALQFKDVKLFFVTTHKILLELVEECHLFLHGTFVK